MNLATISYDHRHYELTTANTVPQSLRVNNSLPCFHRYRLDGITYWSQLSSGNWGANELQEVDKQGIVNLVTQAQEIVPQDSYEPREEVRKSVAIQSSN